MNFDAPYYEHDHRLPEVSEGFLSTKPCDFILEHLNHEKEGDKYLFFDRLSRGYYTEQDYLFWTPFLDAVHFCKTKEDYSDCLMAINAKFGKYTHWLLADSLNTYWGYMFFGIIPIGTEPDKMPQAAGNARAFMLAHYRDPSAHMEDVLDVPHPGEGEAVRIHLGEHKLFGEGEGTTATYKTSYGEPFLIYPFRIEHDLTTDKESICIRSYHLGPDRKTDVVIPLSYIADPTKLMKLLDYGIPVDKLSAKYLSGLLTEMVFHSRDEIPVFYRTPHIGWLDEVPDGGFVPYFSRAIFSKENQFGREFEAVSAFSGFLSDWKKLIAQWRDKDHLTLRIILAASFSSVLVRKLGCLPYILDIWGSVSGLGKTVALMTAASVWGKPGDDDGYIKTFNSTDIALEQAAQFCCDLPLLIDELQTIQGRPSFDNLIYQLCEGVPRGRASSQGGLRRQGGWKNCIIMTGEQPVVSANSRAGSLNRVVELCCRTPLFTDSAEAMNDFCNQLRQNYGTAGRFFVERLMQEGSMDHVRSLFADYQRELISIASGKQALSGALILTADTLIDEWLFEDGLKILPEELAAFLKSDNEIDTNKNAMDDLWDHIHKNMRDFTEEGRFMLGEYGKVTAGKRVCAMRHAEFMSFVRSHNYSPESLMEWGVGNGRIIGGNGEVRRSVRIGGPKAPSVWCICLVIPEEADDEEPDDDLTADPEKDTI